MVFGTDGISQIIYFLLFFVFIFLYPKLMLTQIMAKLNKELIEFEKMAADSMKKTANFMGGSVSKNRKTLSRLSDFFAVSPDSTDPTGVMHKFDKLLNEARDSISYTIRKNTNIKDEVKLKNIETSAALTASNYQIAKVVKHFIEVIKKYKNYQIAMIIQMQMPMIKDIAKSMNKSVETTIEGYPWGDSVGPLVAAELAGKNKVNKIKGRMAYSVATIKGRKCIITKADGPGSDTGSPGQAIEYLVKKYKPVRMITVDAAGKLEGEKTGSVASGIGVVMGPPEGPKVDRYFIEEAILKHNIPVDGVAIKMGMEDAITWMPEEVYKAVPTAIEYVHEALEKVPKSKTALIMGVGNTIGIPNGGNLESTYDKIKKGAKKSKKIKEDEKPKGWFGRKKIEKERPQPMID